MDVKFEVTRVTPEIAEKFLEKNTRNRGISKDKVSYYKDQILADKWQLNGQGIIFSKEGQLLDGQHRLQAIVDAKKAIEILIIKNIDAETFTTIDTGKKRNSSDVLQIECQEQTPKNIRALSHAAKVLKCVENKWSPLAYGQMARISNDDVLKYYRDNKEELETNLQYLTPFFITRDEVNHCTELGISPGDVLYMYTLASRQNKKQADDFFKRLLTGYLSDEGDPLATMRGLLINARLEQKSGIYVRKWIRIIWIFYFLNKYYTNHPIRNKRTIMKQNNWIDLKLKPEEVE